MPFFQNPFQNDFRGIWVLSDRQYSIEFKVAGNVNALGLMQAYNLPPYDVSANQSLTINFSFDGGNAWTVTTIANVGSTAANPAAAQPFEIVSALNDPSNALFVQFFTALVNTDGQGRSYVQIRQNQSRTFHAGFVWYISNGNAESVLRFNKKAGVAELPTYFQRHAVPIVASAAITNATNTTPIQITSNGHRLQTGNLVVVSNVGGNTAANNTVTNPIWSITRVDANNFTLDGSSGNFAYTSGGQWVWYNTPDAQHTLIELDPTNISTDTTIVSDAGLNPSFIQADWQLVKGRAGLFTFQNITVDGSDRITQIIEYPAGAQVGDLGRLIEYKYSGSLTHPYQITEIPHTLTSADLVTP